MQDEAGGGGQRMTKWLGRRFRRQNPREVGGVCGTSPTGAAPVAVARPKWPSTRQCTWRPVVTSCPGSTPPAVRLIVQPPTAYGPNGRKSYAHKGKKKSPLEWEASIQLREISGAVLWSCANSSATMHPDRLARIPKASRSAHEAPKAEPPETETPAVPKKTLLFDDDNNSDDADVNGGVELKVNEEYAKRFEHNKKREERQRRMSTPLFCAALSRANARLRSRGEVQDGWR